MFVRYTVNEVLKKEAGNLSKTPRLGVNLQEADLSLNLYICVYDSSVFLFFF